MQAPDPSFSRRKQNILLQALTRKTPQERGAFLDGACGDDLGLRADMEILLAGKQEHQEPGHLKRSVGRLQIEEGAIELTPTILHESSFTEGPGAVIGRYKLLDQIGEGGCGVVYQAEQSEPVKRRVALKVIKLGWIPGNHRPL